MGRYIWILGIYTSLIQNLLRRYCRLEDCPLASRRGVTERHRKSGSNFSTWSTSHVGHFEREILISLSRALPWLESKVWLTKEPKSMGDFRLVAFMDGTSVLVSTWCTVRMWRFPDYAKTSCRKIKVEFLSQWRWVLLEGEENGTCSNIRSLGSEYDEDSGQVQSKFWEHSCVFP